MCEQPEEDEDEDITRSTLTDLVQYFAKTTFKTYENNPKCDSINRHCLRLFSKDYNYSVIENDNGDLCSHYPGKIIICESLKLEHSGRVAHTGTDIPSLTDMIRKARLARCRSRFVVPVLLFDDKSICRSATISSAPELYAREYGRSGYDFFFAGCSRNGDNSTKYEQEELIGDPPTNLTSQNHQGQNLKEDKDLNYNGDVKQESDLFNKIRGNDVRLLKEFSIKYIVDLMVEQKKVKFGMNITSSEKVDKESRYSEFLISSVPYPGCEFFRDFKNNCYSGEGIFFDWNQAFVDAHFNIPREMPSPLHIEWKKYKSWDLVTLTQNYLLFLLQLLKEGEGGVLIHCISGWDRTPLFISLLRITLWADGRAHKSLSAAEILYLTIAYDWLLFGHDLENRMTKGEEVFFFCFNFLKHITSDKFSMNMPRSASFQQLRPRQRTLSFTQFENILLDSPHSRTSSSTSLCSLSSVASDRHSCGCDSIIEGAEYENGRNISRNGSVSSLSSTGGPCKPSQCPTATSNIPVPGRPPSVTEQKSSSSLCGSWQLISDTGSPRGTATVKDSPLPIARSSSSTSLSDGDDETTLPTRHQRLESVRTLFHSVYAGAIATAYGNHSNGRQMSNGVFTGLIDQVTSRMQLKTTWVTSV